MSLADNLKLQGKTKSSTKSVSRFSLKSDLFIKKQRNVAYVTIFYLANYCFGQFEHFVFNWAFPGLFLDFIFLS